MTLAIDEKFISACEKQLGARFPESYRKSMMNQNGGVVEIDDLEWDLVPIADIVSETNDDATWNGYPNRAVSIGRDMFGDILVLLRLGPGFSNRVYHWDHDDGEIYCAAEDFSALKRMR